MIGRRAGGCLWAEPGDRLLVRPRHLGEHPRDAEVLEAMGADGGPPFRVRWEDDGRVGIHHPGADEVVEHLHLRRRGSHLTARG